MPDSPGRGSRGAVWMAVALLALVGVAAWQVWVIPSPPVYATVGPSLMPAVVVGLLGILALGYLVQSLRGRSVDVLDDPQEQPLPGRVARVALLVGALAAWMALTPWLGIGVAGVAGFVLIARAFDSRRWLRDLIVATVFSATVWGTFHLLLGVQLGPFARLPWG